MRKTINDLSDEALLAVNALRSVYQSERCLGTVIQLNGAEYVDVGTSYGVLKEDSAHVEVV